MRRKNINTTSNNDVSTAEYHVFAICLHFYRSNDSKPAGTRIEDRKHVTKEAPECTASATASSMRIFLSSLCCFLGILLTLLEALCVVVVIVGNCLVLFVRSTLISVNFGNESPEGCTTKSTSAGWYPSAFTYNALLLKSSHRRTNFTISV